MVELKPWSVCCRICWRATFSHCSSSVYTCRCTGVITCSNSVIRVVALSNVPDIVLTTLQVLSHLILITREDTHCADREPEIRRSWPRSHNWKVTELERWLPIFWPCNIAIYTGMSVINQSFSVQTRICVYPIYKPSWCGAYNQWDSEGRLWGSF